MRQTVCIALLAAFTILAAAEDKPPVHKQVTVAQLQRTVADSHGATDAALAQQLAMLELTERLGTTQLAQLSSEVPGEKSRQGLLLLADQSAFLDPPDAEIPNKPAPSPEETRRMLVQIVNYVNTTLRQLPNFIATRDTAAFEDRPKEDVLEANATVSYSYQPLHFVGKSTATVTYSDHKEVVGDSPKKASTKGQIGGLVTAGEFGPILTTVVADALKGKITWARWENGPAGAEAVFHYAVPEGGSHYRVRFCCLVNGYTADGQPDMQIFDEQSAYHGEIAFNPLDGSILRITVEAEMPPTGLVPKAGILVEYRPVAIGGREYICPSGSISLLLAHIQRPQGMFSRATYSGPAKTFLNDVSFGGYRRFGSEVRILSDAADAPQQ